MTAIVTITGTIGRDAEQKVSGAGKTMVSFSVAVEQYEGAGRDKTTAWYNVTAWGDRWKWLLQHAVKGSRACVVGELKRRDYEGSKGAGVALEVSAVTIDVFARGEGGAGRRQQPQSAANAGGQVDDEDIPF